MSPSSGIPRQDEKRSCEATFPVGLLPTNRNTLHSFRDPYSCGGSVGQHSREFPLRSLYSRPRKEFAGACINGEEQNTQSCIKHCGQNSVKHGCVDTDTNCCCDTLAAHFNLQRQTTSNSKHESNGHEQFTIDVQERGRTTRIRPSHGALHAIVHNHNKTYTCERCVRFWNIAFGSVAMLL